MLTSKIDRDNRIHGLMSFDISILGRYKRDDDDDDDVIVDTVYAECESDEDCSAVQTCDVAVKICKMTWWMILIIVLLVLIGVGAIIACLCRCLTCGACCGK